MTEIKSISVSAEFAMKAKELKLSWSEAARVGMAILLAERGEAEYDNKLNLFRKMNFFKSEAEKSILKVEELNKKLIEKDGIEKVEVKDEFIKV